MMKRLLISTFLLLFSAGTANAQTTAPAPADLAKPLAPLVDEQTLIVAHVDLDRIDVDACAAVARKLATAAGAEEKEVAPGIDAAVGVAKPILDRLRAAGIKHVYYIASLSDFPLSPGAVLVPMPTAEKAQEAIKAMAFVTDPGGPGNDMGITRAEIIGTTAVFSDKAGLERLKKRAGNRPDIAEAFSAAGEGAAHLLIVPSPAMRKLAAELMPTVPKELGGGSTEGLLKGLQCVGMGIAPPPELEIRIRVAAADAEGAERALAMFKALKVELIRLANQHAKDPDATDAKMVAAIADILTPKTDGASLTLFLRQDDLIRAAKVFSGPVADARESAIRQVSMTRVRQITQAALIFATDGQKQWPASLDTLIKGKQLTADLLISPNDGQPYVYRSPTAEEIKKGMFGQLPVVWEQAGKKGFRVVAFGDGHAEMLDAAAFKKIMERAGIKVKP